MHDKLMKMLGKKKDLSDNEKHAKMDVVKDLRDMAADEMGSRLGHIKKVSVASDSDAGLKHGLDKAKQILSSKDESDMVDDAENPYSDVEHAADEHMSEGGEVPSPDQGDYEDVDQESPAEESEEHEDESDEFHGLDMDEVNKKLEKLMKMRDSMMKHKS